jgi:hypothetical protein
LRIGPSFVGFGKTVAELRAQRGEFVEEQRVSGAREAIGA